MTHDDRDFASAPREAKHGSIVDAIFSVTDSDHEAAAADNDPLNGALQAVLARRMREMLAGGRVNSKAA